MVEGNAASQRCALVPRLTTHYQYLTYDSMRSLLLGVNKERGKISTLQSSPVDCFCDVSSVENSKLSNC
jgi:hypothetical protein